MSLAIDVGATISLDNLEELEMVEAIARRMRAPARVQPRTRLELRSLDGIISDWPRGVPIGPGARGHKFGMHYEDVLESCRRALRLGLAGPDWSASSRRPLDQRPAAAADRRPRASRMGRSFAGCTGLDATPAGYGRRTGVGSSGGSWTRRQRPHRARLRGIRRGDGRRAQRRPRPLRSGGTGADARTGPRPGQQHRHLAVAGGLNQDLAWPQDLGQRRREPESSAQYPVGELVLPRRRR